MSAAPERAEHLLDDDRRIGEAPDAEVAAGQASRLWRHDRHPARGEDREVVAHRGVLPHLRVHGWTDHDRRSGGKQRGGEEVVGETAGVPCEEVRCGGRHDHQVGARGELGVGHRRLLVPEAHLRGFRGERIEGDPADEAGRRLGEHRGDVHPGVDQATADFDRLVASDPRRHTEHDHRRVLTAASALRVG